MPATGGSGRAAGNDGPPTSCCVRNVLSPIAFCVCSEGRAFEWESGGVGSSAGALGLAKRRRKYSEMN